MATKYLKLSCFL